MYTNNSKFIKETSTGIEPITTSKRKDKTVKPKGRRLQPGKERCDICGRDFFNLAQHKSSSHALLKKPVECCGITFTTGHSFKTHRKSGCSFKSKHKRL